MVCSWEDGISLGFASNATQYKDTLSPFYLPALHYLSGGGGNTSSVIPVGDKCQRHCVSLPCGVLARFRDIEMIHTPYKTIDSVDFNFLQPILPNRHIHFIFTSFSLMLSSAPVYINQPDAHSGITLCHFSFPLNKEAIANRSLFQGS